MVKAFNKVLDECVDCINRGERLEDCLASYPEHAKELEPLLRAMHDAQMAYTFTPSPMAKMAARQRFNVALEESARRRQERQPLFPRVLGWSKAGVAVAAVLLVALIGYFGLRPMLFPIGPVPQPGPLPVAPSPQPSPEGNFVFLISDDVNAIGDFHSLNVTISKIGLQPEGEAEQWIELNPQVHLVDLTLLQGDKAQEIWNGYVEPGEYIKVFIHVDNVTGILYGADGGEADVKLPSEKLQISKPFEVTSDSIVNFVYDITVVEAGKSGQYILKPQVGQSGADQRFEKIDGKGRDRPR